MIELTYSSTMENKDESTSKAGTTNENGDLLCCPPGMVEKGFCNQSFEQDQNMNMKPSEKISFFAKYLTVWVAIAMGVGTLIGTLAPAVPDALEKATVADIWIPGAVLVWLMVYPMMLKVRWSAIRNAHEHPGGLFLTTFINWAIQPFMMYALAVLFFNIFYGNILSDDKQSEYISGAVILGGSPCTAMVFVWSSLAKGDPNYTLVQVVLNDIILLFLYVPTAKLLLNTSNIALPWDTVYLSVILFVVIPFALGTITHVVMSRYSNGEEKLQRIDSLFSPISSISLILLVVFIFISQAKVITQSPADVFLIAVPLMIQTIFIFALTYTLAWYFCLEHKIAGPAAFVGSSNFFELAVAVALAVYGPGSGAVLVSVVGVLVEVPLMLLEVAFVNATKRRYEGRLNDTNCHCKQA